MKVGYSCRKVLTMMNLGRNQLILGTLGILIAVAVIVGAAGFPPAVIVMALIAAIAFLTVVVVMRVGLEHGEAPVAASDSSAVSVWQQRAARQPEATNAAQISEAEAAPTAQAAKVESASGAATGKSVADLSDEEKEAKRQAALERRKAREAKQSEQSEK
jgi:hypothetical protein